ncbi:MAG TPA: hypothetical protein VFF63_05765 [Candidatus Babeliales bacterium]|nr:hypothetical protein [Candidatus Babeliales bacterium]
MLPLPDADAIWLHTRSAVTAAQYPGRIDYTIAVSGLDGARQTSDHYRADCDPRDGAIRLFPISDEELAQPPPVPHGVNFHFDVGLSEGRNSPAVAALPAGHPALNVDLLGEPLLSPTYMFGLRYAAPTNNAAPDAENSLRVIAIVSAQSPAYRVALTDTPSIDGVETYHLKLTPLRKPKENRLREIWVGAADYLPRRAVIAGNFTVAPLVDVPWTVDFLIVDGAPYIARESAAAMLYLAHKRVVRDATIAFENIHEPSGSLYDEPLVEPAATATTLTEPQT